MFHDLKFTLRSLLKTPGFTAVAVLTLALGIGATTAIFSVVNTVLLKPLPYVHPERLARIYAEFPTYPNGGIHRFVVSGAEYFYLRREMKSWESIDAWTGAGINMASAAEPARITASYVTGGLLSSLGVAPAFGRLIASRDAEPGATPVALISYRLWQSAFAGDRSILGRDILLNGIKHSVIGVMPQAFAFPIGEPDATQVWSALQLDPGKANSNSHDLWLLGRLKPGVTVQQAQAELDTVLKRRLEVSPGHFLDSKDHPLVTYGLSDEVTENVRPALRMLMGAVCFLLLIAGINVANLLLVRAEGRQREVAVRSALGAGLWNLLRQFATEGLLLSVSAAALGLLLAFGGLKIMGLSGAMGMPRAEDIAIDGPVMLFALAVSVLIGVVFSLAPLVYVVQRNFHAAMKSSAASTTGGVGAQRFRQMLVIGQLALALVLLSGTGLMLRAFWNLQQVDAGFDPKGVTTLSVGLPDSVYPGQVARDFWTSLQERLGALPGVDNAALSAALPPLIDSGIGFGILVEGLAPPQGNSIQFKSTAQGTRTMVDYFQVVTPGYFNTLKIRPIAGRLFDARDDAQSTKVVIVNQTTARTLWGTENALGRRINPMGGDWYTVVGVVADSKNAGIDKPAGTEIDLPYMQVNPNLGFLRRVRIAIRSQSATVTVVSAARGAVRDIDPALPVVDVRSMEELIAASQSRPRFLTLLLTLFSGVALLLAAVGIYGVMSYAVAQRTREFGIRMALGSERSAVLGLVLRRGLALTACGLAAGLAGAFALTRFLATFLFGVTATDPTIFAAVALLLGVIAAAASYLPARRATKVDPLVALRTE